MTTDTTQLADWQLDVAGVLIGHGTDVLIEDIDGIGTPERRAGDRPIPDEDGNYPGKDTYAPRTLRITAGIRTPGNPAAGLDQLAELERAADTKVRLTPGATDVLRIRRPGQPVRRQYGRLAGVEAISLADAPFGWIPIHVTFVALDPAWYADTPSGLNLGLDVSNQRGQGFGAPLRAPMTTGTADPKARPGWALNTGNRPTWPTVRITGPVVNPKVWIEGTDAVLDLAVVLGDGETLDIETRPGTRTVIRNGLGSAAGALTRASRLDAFAIPPGRSEVRWTAQDATGTSRLALTWRDASSSL
ncbi:hypothetical protein [Kitasatospora brasiliensis]|uniref:hypothetical protein n=1 Tax=Kitasatospora brasiliensis TaxID=3058040 RepID=UPI00292DA33F|nr:hypothetical protein [Kitasatospora sp. K002]